MSYRVAIEVAEADLCDAEEAEDHELAEDEEGHKAYTRGPSHKLI